MRYRLILITALALLPLSTALADDVDDYNRGYGAGYGAAADRNDQIGLPTDLNSGTGLGDQGYRAGYGDSEQENRDRSCFYGQSPFPCR